MRDQSGRELELRWLSGQEARADAARTALLAQAGLDADDTPPSGADVLEVWCQGRLAATGTRTGSLIRQLAVLPAERGQDLMALVVTGLRKRMLAEDILHCRVYTRPERRDDFTSLGFRVLARADAALLLESGPGGLAAYLDFLRGQAGADPAPAGCVVMHANPFTLGHRWLVEQALAACGRVWVFILRGAGASLFPYEVRRNLALRGLAHLPAVRVLDGGEYVISPWAFPRYFLKQADEHARVQAQLDLELFSRHLAPVLYVTARFAGEEPEDELTAIYNATMQRVLPGAGISFTQVPRRRDAGGAYISAGRVRRHLLAGQLDQVRGSLPESTFDFLQGAGGRELVRRHRQGEAPRA